MVDSQAKTKFLTQPEAIKVDEIFFNSLGYSVDQLMELAGLSVATAIHREFPPSTHSRVLVVCGPGNNGGDGLVCARHLFYFGYTPSIVYPKRGSSQLLQNLARQMEVHEIPIRDTLPNLSEYDLIVDAIFGHSFRPPVRGSFSDIIKAINVSKKPIAVVDIPSGWDVENGDISGTGVQKVNLWVSLSCPKLCAKSFAGCHYLGGRFVPPFMAREMELNLPIYPASDPVVKLS